MSCVKMVEPFESEMQFGMLSPVGAAMSPREGPLLDCLAD